MDVVLDSNVYVSDYRMESIAFKNLFDYLKRTKSSLVLLRIVREEVVAQFVRELKKRSQKAADAWKSYRALHFPDKLPEFHPPDFSDQKKRLRARLMAPSASIKVEYHADTTRISVDEVFIRGVHRRAPANSDGEELRDVIVWLSALDYSKNLNRELAFISNDSGFWLDENIHPQIQADIVNRSDGKVHLYRTIDKFVEENSPPAKAADVEWAYNVFPAFADTVVEVAKRAFEARWWSGSVKSISLKSVAFSEGKVFEVAPDVQVAELLFKINLQCESTLVTNLVPLGGLVNVMSPPFPQPIKLSNSLVNAGYGGRRLAVAGGVSYTQGAGLAGPPWNWLDTSENNMVQPTVIDKQYNLSVSVRLSARLLKGQISEKEVTDLQIEQVEEVKPNPTGMTSEVPR